MAEQDLEKFVAKLRKVAIEPVVGKRFNQALGVVAEFSKTTNRFVPRTRRLITSTKGKATGFEGKLFNEVSYAGYVHEGTRPHVIKPKSTKSLKFKVGGATVFAKKVNHPGYKGDPWIERAWKARENAVINFIERTTVSDITKELRL